jgi:transposase
VSNLAFFDLNYLSTLVCGQSSVSGSCFERNGLEKRMTEPNYDKLSEENAELRRQLTQLQEQLTAALSGNAELLAQLKALQEKLDRVLAQKKNRDRKEFKSKNEGCNPRPASPDSGRKRKPPGQEEEEDSGKSKKNSFIDSPNLEPEIIPHPVSDENRICPHCQVETVFVGEKVTHQLEKLVHSLKRLEHHQEVRSCPKCRTYITTGIKPTPPIPGSYAGPCLLAHMVVNKVEDAIPNHRQEKMLAREDIPFPRSTQCDWFIALSLLVTPLYDLLNRELLASDIVQTDETPLKVQDRRLKGNMRIAKLTGYRGDANHKLVSFDFSPNGSFERNRQFLKDFAGIIQADAAIGFDALFKNNSARTEAGCNAHARRRIFDARGTSPKIADRMLQIYTHLYDIERVARGKPQGVRLAMRRRFSSPLMKKLRIMHLRNKASLRPSELLVDAANYALRHWRALTRFLKNPEIEIDNNAMEREIKPVVLTRKNVLFAGSDAGGRALAIHRSLVASARRNGLNPVEYLTDVFNRINDLKTSDLHQLLPNHWAESRKPDKIKTQEIQKT